MNRLEGTIRRIESSASVSLVEVSVGGDLFFSVVLERPDNHPYLRPGGPIRLLFKDTEVVLAKDPTCRVSLINRAAGRIRRIETGTVLTRVELDYEAGPVAAVVSSRSARELSLAAGDEVVWMVKASEISLMEP
jgi:molybdate transport system regulatory protein